MGKTVKWVIKTIGEGAAEKRLKREEEKEYAVIFHLYCEGRHTVLGLLAKSGIIGPQGWDLRGERPASWPANCPTNQSSKSRGTHPVREDTGGWEARAARFSTHREVAKESCSVATVLLRARAEAQWVEPDLRPSIRPSVRPAGTTSRPPAPTRPARCLLFQLMLRESPLLVEQSLRLLVNSNGWCHRTEWLWSQLASWTKGRNDAALYISLAPSDWSDTFSQVCTDITIWYDFNWGRPRRCLFQS